MTDANPKSINLTEVKVVGYCHHCQLRLLNYLPIWVVKDDDFLCPYYNARKLAFCSKGCLDKQLAFVLEKLKEARNKNP